MKIINVCQVFLVDHFLKAYIFLSSRLKYGVIPALTRVAHSEIKSGVCRPTADPTHKFRGFAGRNPIRRRHFRHADFVGHPEFSARRFRRGPELPDTPTLRFFRIARFTELPTPRTPQNRAFTAINECLHFKMTKF